jgi:predicted nucleic acid-binding protein
MASGARVIVVDTTVWADWFNGMGSPEVDHLEDALHCQDAGLAPVILTEVLRGFRADRDFERAHALLVQLPCWRSTSKATRSRSALSSAPGQGITVRGTIDRIIAQTCIAAAVELISTDQDFAAIARHTPLLLCAV